MSCGVRARSTGLLGYQVTISPVFREKRDDVAGHSMQKSCVNLLAMNPSLYAPSAGDLSIRHSTELSVLRWVDFKTLVCVPACMHAYVCAGRVEGRGVVSRQ